MIKQSILLFSILMASNSVGAFCSSPIEPFDSLPSPPSVFGKPTEPFCLSDYKFTGKHTCAAWELDSYFNDIEQYVAELKRFTEEVRSYANEVIDYANSAVDYANCEISSLNDRVR